MFFAFTLCKIHLRTKCVFNLCKLIICNVLHCVWFKLYSRVRRGEEGQPQQVLVRATLSLFSRPSHLEKRSLHHAGHRISFADS